MTAFAVNIPPDWFSPNANLAALATLLAASVLFPNAPSTAFALVAVSKEMFVAAAAVDVVADVVVAVVKENLVFAIPPSLVVLELHQWNSLLLIQFPVFASVPSMIDTDGRHRRHRRTTPTRRKTTYLCVSSRLTFPDTFPESLCKFHTFEL